MKLNYILWGILLLSILPMVSAEDYYKLDSCAILKVKCSNCSWVNISSVTYPNGTQALGQNVMTLVAGGEWQYNCLNVSTIGTWHIWAFGSNGNSDDSYFYVTPTGEDTTGLLSLGMIVGFILIAGLLFYSSTLFGKSAEGVKTLLIVGGLGFLIVTAQVAKISISGKTWLSNMGNIGTLLMIVIFSFMIFYFMIIYTRNLFIKLRHSKEKRLYGDDFAQ